MSATGMTRREILIGGGMLVAAGALPWACSRQLDREAFRRAALPLFSSPESMRPLAGAIRTELGVAEAARLVESLAQALDWRPDLPAQTLADRVTKHIATQFRQSELMRVEGWTLSRAEGALCLLLNPPNQGSTPTP